MFLFAILSPRCCYSSSFSRIRNTATALTSNSTPATTSIPACSFAHAYLRSKPPQSAATICGGELAGHYYFRDFFHCDSGELAALRLLVAIARAKAAGMKVSEFLAPVARKYANSGEMNFKVDDKEAAIARVLEEAKGLGVETGRSDIDGYRLEYAEGWVSVRQSNTEPLLRLLVECDTPERLEQWRGRLVAAV